MIKSSLALVILTIFLTGCVSTSVNRPDVPVTDEIARLKQLGFRQVTKTADGTYILRYSGPITRAVECRRSSDSYAPIPARRRISSGQTQTITLDAYLRLSPGADDILSGHERDGIYIVTIRTRGGGRGTALTGTKFGPRGRGSFASGLTCRAA